MNSHPEPTVLRWIGAPGSFVPGLPQRDLTQRDLDLYGWTLEAAAAFTDSFAVPERADAAPVELFTAADAKPRRAAQSTKE